MCTKRALRLFKISQGKVDNFVEHFRTSTGSTNISVLIRGKVKRHYCVFKLKLVSDEKYILCKLKFQIREFSHVKKFEKLLSALMITFS